MTARTIWACDYCYFVFHDEDQPFLEIVGRGRAEEAFIVVGRGDEFESYDVATEEEALDSGLDIMHLHDMPITYEGKSDEELGYEYGEFGSDSDWLQRFGERNAILGSPEEKPSDEKWTD